MKTNVNIATARIHFPDVLKQGLMEDTPFECCFREIKAPVVITYRFRVAKAATVSNLKFNYMATKSKVSKVLIALGLSKLTVPQLIANSNSYVQHMTGNAFFITPNPPLATLSAQVSKVEAALTLSATRVKGSVAAMHTEQRSLNILLKSLATYVEETANATPEQALEIAQSTTMPIKKQMVRAPKVFAVKLTSTPGEVLLNTKAVKKAIYTYAMTTDPATVTSWVNIIVNNDVKNLHSGLSSGTRYYFRVATTVKGVQSPWSPTINIMMP
jgi:hypothetical protein